MRSEVEEKWVFVYLDTFFVLRRNPRTLQRLLQIIMTENAETSLEFFNPITTALVVGKIANLPIFSLADINEVKVSETVD